MRLWVVLLAQAQERSKTYLNQASAAQKRIEKLLDRIVDAESASLIAAYEARIAKLEREKLVAEERSAEIKQPRKTSEDLSELAFGILSNPNYIYKKGALLIKKRSWERRFRRPLPTESLGVFEPQKPYDLGT